MGHGASPSRILALLSVRLPPLLRQLRANVWRQHPASLLRAQVGESGDWVGLFGVDEFDCAEPFEWPVDEEDLEREVGLDVSL